MPYVVIESTLDRNFSFFSTPVANCAIEVKSFGDLHLTDGKIHLECNEIPYLEVKKLKV